MKLYLTSIVLLLFPPSSICQENDVANQKSVIQVIGYSEEKIAPNEIYISLTLFEYYQGRKLIKIEDQERNLIDSLARYGIPKDNIKAFKTKAQYKKVKPLKKGTVASKSYSIIGNDAKDVRNVFSVLRNLKIQSAYIEKVSHSEIEEIRKRNRIKAIKNAKDKAEYLLSAIDEELGKPMLIKETNSAGVTVRGSRPSATDYYIDGIRVSQSQPLDTSKYVKEVEFKDIIVESGVFIKFEIK